jgi:hypothetical protein
MIVQNGIVQRTKDETPIDWIVSGQWIEGPDEFYYYNNPFNQTPWISFYGKPKVLGAPSDFLRIFGPRPNDMDREGQNFWDQQLSLFVKIQLPDGVTDAQAANVETLFLHYGVGIPISWLTTRGDYIVTPTKIKELSGMDFGPEVYERPLHAITILQVKLIELKIKPKVLSSFLTNLQITHQE